jgi:hypothetical protein
MSSIHDDAGSRHKSVSRLHHERPSSAKQGMKKNGKDERKGPRFELIVAIEQWICLILGIACIASGTWGIFLKLSQHALPAYPAWLGLAYVPTLRLTAVACLVMGLVLVRRGVTPSWLRSANTVSAQLTKGGSTMKDNVDDIPMVYLLYVLLAIAAIVTAAGLLVMRLLFWRRQSITQASTDRL